MTPALDREAVRIRWRQTLMSVPGGVAWLLHVSRLYDHQERLIGPHHIGLPDDIRLSMAQISEKPV